MASLVKIKGIIHNLKMYRLALREDPRIDELFQSLIEEIKKKQDLSKTIDNQLLSLYIIETSVGHVKVGISGNPIERLKNLTTGGGYTIVRYYVTLPIAKTKSKEQKILNEFKHHRREGEYLTCSFDAVVKYFEDTYGTEFKNPSFKITYEFTRFFKNKVYCSNGLVYKSVGSFAKAFGISTKKALEHLNSGHPIKEVTIQATKKPIHPLSSETSAVPAKPFVPQVIIRKKSEPPTTES